MNRATLVLAVLTLFLGAWEQAKADLVYSLSGPAEFFTQQAGNNMYYYGDDVTLAPGAPRQLDTVALTFLFYNPAGGSYTPDLSLSIFPIDPVTRLPNGPALGTATENTESFPGGDGSTAHPYVLQQATFDFSSQNVILPDDFAFAYRDNNPNAGTDPDYGFSVVGSTTGTPTVGSTVYGFLDAYPNGVPFTWQFGTNGEIPGDTSAGNLLADITASASAVPEPASLTLFGMMSFIGAAYYGWQHRKRLTFA